MQDHATRGTQGGDAHKQRAFAPLLTLELCEELLDSIVPWAVSYKQLLSDQQGAAWFVDGSSKMTRQHPV